MLDLMKVIWQGAMDEEMNSMKVNEVWTEVDPPPNAKIVRSKWIFKKKTDMDGKVHTYKARLVAKGCTQTYGVDYEETFPSCSNNRAVTRPDGGVCSNLVIDINRIQESSHWVARMKRISDVLCPLSLWRSSRLEEQKSRQPLQCKQRKLEYMPAIRSCNGSSLDRSLVEILE
ncbi:retrotransposon protein, putative, ty1-copia subclass [Tanacetum coccineum]